jgi:hypothetical protein
MSANRGSAAAIGNHGNATTIGSRGNTTTIVSCGSGPAIATTGPAKNTTWSASANLSVKARARAAR